MVVTLVQAALPMASDIPTPVQTLDLDQQPLIQSDYDDTSFTDGDRATIVCDDKEVTHRPARIEQRVARYTEMNTLFVNWLITYAQQHNYHNLSSIVSRRRRGRGRRINIRAPVDKNYELLARHLVRHLTVPSSVTDYIREIIQLRTFVSDWYINMHRMTDPLETCEIAARTEKHRAFIDMLEHLRQILCDNQGHESGPEEMEIGSFYDDQGSTQRDLMAQWPSACWSTSEPEILMDRIQSLNVQILPQEA
ncbi:hypothetical protein LTR27_001505 [Elasticomyces elasticus]|nr:hypothetical protein LTR27_001505 [Elasticomyces elasticus]